MLRLALLITGTSRNYKVNYVTWKKYLFDLFDTDIFFHTYDVTGYHDEIYNNKINSFNPNDIIQLLKPKKYIIDSFTNKITEFKKKVVSQCSRSNSPNPEFIKAQLYSIYQVNELKKMYEKENKFEYDCVIKIRFDTIFHSEFDINDITKIYSTNNIILCGNPSIKTMKYKNACLKCIENFNKLINKKCDSHNDISDIVFMSKSNIMNHYANIYNKYDSYITDMVTQTKKVCDLNKYISHTYDNNAQIYLGIPKAICPYPEKILALYLKDYILLNYSIALDINRTRT